MIHGLSLDGNRRSQPLAPQHPYLVRQVGVGLFNVFDLHDHAPCLPLGDGLEMLFSADLPALGLMQRLFA